MLDFFKGTVTPRDWAAVAIILSATLLVGVLFYFLIYKTQQVSIAEVEKTLKSVKTDLAKAREIEKDIENLRAEGQKMNLLVERFEKRLPASSQIPTLFRDVEKLGTQLGLRVQIEALPRITDQRKETIPYNVTAWGDFHQIVSFINLLEKDERYLKISELNIAEEEEGVSAGGFTLSTFRFIEPAPVTTPEPKPKDEKKS